MEEERALETGPVSQRWMDSQQKALVALQSSLLRCHAALS